MELPILATVIVTYREERPGMGMEKETFNFSSMSAAIDFASRQRQLAGVYSVNIKGAQ